MNPNKRQEPRAVSIDPRHPSVHVKDRLILKHKLAEGGMAEIFVAEDRNLGRHMAVKRLLPHASRDDLRMGRLVGEAQVIAQLDHPNIVPVHELCEDSNGELFYSMKLVQGEDLGQILDGQDPRFRDQDEMFELMQIFLKVCDALAFAHSREVIHRDVKPENIMVGEYGEVYLMDWGLALPMGGSMAEPDSGTRRYTVTGPINKIVGTPGYMAPEQARAEVDTLDNRADIWALGSILYLFITGKPPVGGGTPFHAIFSTLHDVIPHPDEVTDYGPQPELCRIAMKALAKDRADRYARVEDLKADLERFLRRGWQPPVRAYAAGTLLIKEGEEGDEAYIIVEGRCRVVKEIEGELTELRIMGEGEAFGEVALFADMRRTASVEAVGDVKLMIISRRQLEQEIGGGYFLGRLLKGLAGRFVDMDQRYASQLEEVRRRDLADEVLRYLARNGEDVQSKREAPWSVLQETLTLRFGWSGTQLEELVNEIRGIVVDKERDRVGLIVRQQLWG